MMDGDKLDSQFAMATVLERSFIAKMQRQVQVTASNGVLYIECDVGKFKIVQRGDSENWWILTLEHAITADHTATDWWRFPHQATTRLSLLQTWVNWWNNKYVAHDERSI